MMTTCPSYHVVLVALEEGVGLEGLVEVVEDVEVGRLEEVAHPEEGLGLGHALLRQVDRPGLLVHGVVLLGPQPRDDPVGPGVELGALLGGPGDDEGRPGLVDEDGVHLVHDGVVEVPLDEVPGPELHVVAEVVEAELVVGAVGDVAVVGLAPLLVGEAVDDDPGGHPEETVDPPHPLRVAPGQVVVDGDHVDAPAQEGVGVDRHGGRQRLALAGLHLGYHPVVEDQPPH